VHTRGVKKQPVERGVRATLLVLCLLTAVTVSAQGKRFYDRDKEGWFWYEPEPPPPAVPAPEPEPPAATAPAPAPPAPQPAPLSTAWLRENLSHYRDLAIDNPTSQNIALFLYLQRVAMDKSSRFAAMTQRVVQADPFLDEITHRPTAPFGATLADRQSLSQREALLKHLAGMTTIWFFFRSDCPYCDAQAPLLAELEERFGFHVLPISLDGRGLPSDLFASFERDRGQARQLGVVSTPALFLAHPPALQPISQGLLSLSQLQERILLAAVQAGWIEERALDGPRALAAEAPSASSAEGASLPQDPAALLARLRALAKPPR
jgi:conjugal transfer pilus assembly protein TraF